MRVTFKKIGFFYLLSLVIMKENTYKNQKGFVLFDNQII